MDVIKAKKEKRRKLRKKEKRKFSSQELSKKKA